VKIYRGTLEETDLGGRVVLVNPGPLQYRLNPRFDLYNHSPTGFMWGYGGSGPAQLALAILADLLGDDTQALMLYQPFKWKVIATLPMGEDWELTGDDVHEFIRKVA